MCNLVKEHGEEKRAKYDSKQLRAGPEKQPESNAKATWVDVKEYDRTCVDDRCDNDEGVEREDRYD